MDSTRVFPPATFVVATVFAVLMLCGSGVGLLRADEPQPAAPTSSDQQLSKIREEWKSRSTRFRSVHYRLRGEILHTAGSSVLPGDPDFEPREIPPTGFPVEDITTEFTIDWLIDFERGLFRKKSEDVSFNVADRAFRPFVREEVFDGNRLIGNWPREANTSESYAPGRSSPDVTIWRPQDLPLIVNGVDFPVFYAHGLVAVRPGKLTSGVLGGDERLRYRGLATIDGWSCVQIGIGEEQTGVVLSIAPEFGGAALRVESYYHGRLKERTDIEYDSPEHGWMPRAWRVSQFLGAIRPEENRILKEYHVRVEDRVLNSPTRPDDFQVKLKEGMIVNQRGVDGRSKLEVQSDGRLAPYRPRTTPHDSVSGSLLLILVLNASVLILGAGTYIAVQRFRRAKSRTP